MYIQLLASTHRPFMQSCLKMCMITNTCHYAFVNKFFSEMLFLSLSIKQIKHCCKFLSNTLTKLSTSFVNKETIS